MNSELERQNQKLTEEVNNFREQETERNFQISLEERQASFLRRESQRFIVKN